MQKTSWTLLLAAALAAGCGGGGDSAEGSFRLIEFLDSGKDSIPRNRDLTFRFSAPVAPGQDLPERLKVQNVQSTQGDSDFSRSIGTYVVSGDEVLFVPRLPQAPDRGDAGFRANGNYHVFLKGGPDALRSTDGDIIARQQEFLFDTNEFFEDPTPGEPPRALRLLARDGSTGAAGDLSRLDPRPLQLAAKTTAELLADSKAVDPGAGGPPGYAIPWVFELEINEPLDPAAVTTRQVELVQIRENAITGTPSNSDMGDPVRFLVPIDVAMVQELNDLGELDIHIRITALQTLVDDARYRLSFSGEILGIDFRKEFRGENGLTGDGQSIVDGEIFDEPGGLGYVTEFLVLDRPAIASSRTVSYDPLTDGIEPERGQTTLDEERLNSALYNPASNPGTAVGFLSDFGDGSDGSLAVSGGQTVELDTGDTPNEFIGNPFVVQDLNANDIYNKTTLTTTPVQYDTPDYFELNLDSLTISSSSTLRVTGVNPVLFRVAGIVQINGTLDAAGRDGQAGSGANANGGEPGAGGGAGGDSLRGVTCSAGTSACQTFASFLTRCTTANSSGPFSQNGAGPGRGMGGAEGWSYGYNELLSGLTGTGGGGGSHATRGEVGEDRYNAGDSAGSAGATCAQGSSLGNSPTRWTRNSSVIGVRGMPGETYGDREVIDIRLGGSGGGGGGTMHANTSGSWNSGTSGGGGGGGGGSLTIFAAGPIIASGGQIDASGGDGGKGLISGNTSWSTSGGRQATGGGGGGSGGVVVLISGDSLSLGGSVVDSAGGSGGARASDGTTINCNGCNAGGDGGKGFIFLMDADGEIDGFLPGIPGEYDDDPRGVLTISGFDTSRFGEIRAITELFAMPAADPTYQPLAPSDVVANVNPNQRIRIFVSSSKTSGDDPLLPDIGEELDPMFEVARVSFVSGAITVDVTGDMEDLNPMGSPDRDAFVRVRSDFEYDDGTEAALGPFAHMDEFTVSVLFN